MLRVLFFSVFFISVLFSKAQQFGGNPNSIQWQQINTDTFRIIFPKGYQTDAQRTANIVSGLQNKQLGSLGTAFRKINIVLQPETLISNGYVSLAPFRSEFYTTPLQNPFVLGGVDPVNNLALHEYRHVQQYNNFNKGLSKFAGYLLGEQGIAVANALAIPDWFFEGDAVYNETKFSKQGRGTLPLFMNKFQTLAIANHLYNYNKIRNGSLRSYVPNHYELGYLLVAYGREKYGDDIWLKVTNDAARFKSLVYPFQNAIQKHTGIRFDQFQKEAMFFYQQQWSKPTTDTLSWLTDIAKNNVVNYKYPYKTISGDLIVLKSSYKNIPAFYLIDPNKIERKLIDKDISTDDYFSYNNGMIIYAAYQPDSRWGNRDYHVIKVYDVLKKEEREIISRTKYFSPDISHNGKYVVAVSTLKDSAKLAIMDATDGKILYHHSEQDAVYAYPKFSAKDDFVYWTARKQNGEMALMKMSLENKMPEALMPFSNRIIGLPNIQGDTLLFSTTHQGKDEIWAIIDGMEKKGPFRLASYATGLYQAVLMHPYELVSAAFTAEGYRLCSIRPKWERIVWKDALTTYPVTQSYRPNDHLFLDQVSNKQYPIDKYRKSYKLGNIHSFRPFFEQPEYSLTLYGQNILNTFQSSIAYTFNQNEQSHKLGFNGVYGGTFLQPVFGISQQWHRSGTFNKDTTLYWNELIAYAGLQLPLNLSGGRQYRYLNLATTFHTDQVKWVGLAEKLFRNRQFQYVQSSIQFSSQQQKAIQQINPIWAQTLRLQYRNAVSQFTANQFLATGSLYFPGLSNNHSLVFTGAFQSRDTMQQYLFSNNFPFARGYQAIDFPRMWRLGLNYHFPIAYPDWGFAQLVYFLRIRANVFFDYAEGKSLRTGLRYPFKTVGTEFFFDTKWWNQQPVSFGIRYNRLLDNEFRGVTQPNVWELILPVNLFQ